ncbi:ComEA family DNA-binding protein [Streptomyces sp. NPDC026673]|uniref:ComEA family DNA-binding protein n=1 Tax=Streptomyces sp. NPDC026673 TaxID=3155724 RepID=UPI0033EB0948
MGPTTATPRHRRHTSATAPTAVRERAAALFDPPPRSAARGAADAPPPPAPDPPAPSVPPVRPPSPRRPAAPDPPGRRAGSSWRLALTERLPTWFSVRCGVEPKTAAALAVVLLVALAFAAHHFRTGRPRTVAVPPTVSALPAAAQATVPGEPRAAARTPRPAPGARAVLVVDVVGKVRKPGLRRLPAGSRVADALDAAGGALPGTDTSALNLARPLADGEQIAVGRPAAPAVAGVPGGAAATGPVSLNTATAEQLDALPGVGPVLARHIIDYRSRRGGFTSVEQLRDVNGIGDRRFSDLRSLVTP